MRNKMKQKKDLKGKKIDAFVIVERKRKRHK
jgi:hypothetical protein